MSRLKAQLTRLVKSCAYLKENKQDDMDQSLITIDMSLDKAVEAKLDEAVTSILGSQ